MSKKFSIILSILFIFVLIIGIKNANAITDCGILSSVNTVYTLENDISAFGDCITIAANNITLDGAGFTITGDTGEDGIVINANNTYIKNINLESFDDGIYSIGLFGIFANITSIGNLKGLFFDSASGSNTLTNVTSESNFANGIEFFGSSNNTLTNTNASLNSFGYGIYFELSSANNILNNITANSNAYGIVMETSSNNSLTNITTDENLNYGIYLSVSSNNNLTSITANKNAVYGIFLDFSSNNNINSTITNTNGYYGIYLSSANNNKLTDISSNGNSAGVQEDSSLNNTFTNVIADGNVDYGFFISGSVNNSFTNITARNCTNGLWFLFSNTNIITNITAYSNINGIYLVSSTTNIITNIIANNNDIGVTLWLAQSNFLTSIIANNNTQDGIYIQGSSTNRLINATANGNGLIGVHMHASGSNNLTYITANNNTYGIYYYAGASNNLTHSVFNNNNDSGVYMLQVNNALFNNVTASNNLNGMHMLGGGTNNRWINITSNNNSFGMLLETVNVNDLISPSINNNTYGIYLNAGNKTTILNLNAVSNSFSIIDSNSSGNILRYNNTLGDIKFFGNTNNLTANGSFTYPGNINITNNTAYINAQAFTGNINKSANITFFGLPTNIVNPKIFKDGVICTNCYNFTALNATTVKFNVTSWSNYSIGSTGAAVDSIYPNFSSSSVFPPSPIGYSFPMTSLVFNTTIINTNGSTGLSFNGVNYTLINLSSAYGIIIQKNLSTGSYTYYFWAYGNGTSHNYNQTSIQNYTITKAPSMVNTYLNSSQNKITLTIGTIIPLTSILATGQLGSMNLTLDSIELNYTESLSQIGVQRLFNSTGNFTVATNYSGNTNYSSDYEEWIVQVVYAITMPNVTTLNATTLTETSIVLNGNITENGGENLTEHGFIYGTESNLTSLTTNTTLGQFNDTGNFSESISSLSGGTTYYFRAYAENSAGTSYGDILSITTLLPSQNISTPSNSEIIIHGYGSGKSLILITPTLTTPIANTPVESYEAGDDIIINWSSFGLMKVIIELYDSNNTKKVWNITITNASLGTYKWKVPKNFNFDLGKEFVVRITDASDPKLSRTSGKIEIIRPAIEEKTIKPSQEIEEPRIKIHIICLFLILIFIIALIAYLINKKIKNVF